MKKTSLNRYDNCGTISNAVNERFSHHTNRSLAQRVKFLRLLLRGAGKSMNEEIKNLKASIYKK